MGGVSPILQGIRRTLVREPNDLATAKRVQRRDPRGHWVRNRVTFAEFKKNAGCALHPALIFAMQLKT